ncbi:MAG TPA: proton-conducting transporter membrane subunit [Bacteroidales bacterium]|nr:proton-conducting transporter membrane subunit [Bacteroidales bacterium]
MSQCELVLLGFFVISLITGVTVGLVHSRKLTRALTLFYVLVHVGFTLCCWFHRGETVFGYFTFDPLGVLLLSVLSLLTITTVYHGFIHVRDAEPKVYSIYHAALIGLVASMSGAYLANGMTTVWIFVEATTLAVAALIYHDRTKLALEATWKYVFVCSLGIALAYLGILFLGFTIHDARLLHLSFDSIAEIARMANPLYLKIAFVFVVVGYSTKMGLFPMHTVTVDAHTVAPPPISAFISTTLMNVGFLAIFRIYALFSATSILPFMNHVLILSGTLSLLVAAGYMLKARHNKRMLAYSSLENMGIVAIGLGIGGIGYYAAILHVVLHSLTKAGLFYQIGQSHKVMGTYELEQSGNYMNLYPAGATALLLGFLCITAIPPSGMFISELYLMKSMVVSGNWILLTVTSLLLCFVIYALLTRVLHIVYSPPREKPIHEPMKVNPLQTLTQYFLFGLVVFICFAQPAPFRELIESIVNTLPK